MGPGQLGLIPISKKKRRIKMKSFSKKTVVMSVVVGCLLGSSAFAGDVGALTTFTAGTPAVAAEVNDNFTAVKTAVDGNAADIATVNASLPGVEWVAISQSFPDLRSAPVNVGQLTLTAPSAGFVVVRFDGMACPSIGDRIVLAASDTSATWHANDGNVNVYNDGVGPSCSPFSHTRVYSVSSGNNSFYAVAQNYVDTGGNGSGSVYATLTAQFFPEHY
jgi:hypothetical protein